MEKVLQYIINNWEALSVGLGALIYRWAEIKVRFSVRLSKEQLAELQQILFEKEKKKINNE